MSACLDMQAIATALGISKQSAFERAKKEGWPFEEQAVRGGKKRLYALAALPKAVREVVQQHQLAAEIAAVKASTPIIHEPVNTAVAIDLSHYTDDQRAKGRAREVLFRFVDNYHGSVQAALNWINTQYQAGALNSALIHALQHAWDKPGNLTLTRDTYNKWVAIKKKRGVAIPLKPTKDFSVKPWHQLAISLAQRPQGSLKTWIAEKVAEQFPEVSYSMVNRFFTEKFSKIDQLKGRHTGSALAAHKFYHTRDYSKNWPFTEVHADGWNTHFTAPHPVTGEFVTLEVWHFHDTTTRFVTPVSVGLTESFEVISKGLENCIRVAGVVAILMTDSTGSVKNDRFEFDPVTSIADRAGITITHPIVGNSQANGISENFNTYLDRCSRELATYQAKGMDSLVHKRVKKLTEKMVKAETIELRKQLKLEIERMGKGLVFESYSQAVDWINAQVEAFNDKPHRSLPKIRDEETGKLRHQTPREAINQAIAEGWSPVKVSEADLIDMFRPHERKKVIRGAVRLWGQRYHHPDLEHYNGNEVMVAYDMADGSRIFVKTLKGEFLLEATFYESRDGRCQSFIEMALNKRAGAQIRRLEQKADVIESRRPTETVEQLSYETPIELPVMRIDIHANNVVSMPVKRPWFDSDSAKYRWLNTNKNEVTAQDEAWLTYYKMTSEFEDLFGDREAAIR